jgi:hypothetical protein
MRKVSASEIEPPAAHPRHILRSGGCAAIRGEISMKNLLTVVIVLLALGGGAVLWENMLWPTNVIAADLVSLPISEIELKVDAKSLPDQRIEDRTLVFVDP